MASSLDPSSQITGFLGIYGKQANTFEVFWRNPDKKIRDERSVNAQEGFKHISQQAIKCLQSQGFKDSFLSEKNRPKLYEFRKLLTIIPSDPVEAKRHVEALKKLWKEIQDVSTETKEKTTTYGTFDI